MRKAMSVSSTVRRALTFWLVSPRSKKTLYKSNRCDDINGYAGGQFIEDGGIEGMGKRISFFLIGLHSSVAMVALTVLLALPAAADIYMYIDSQGVMHFTNVPTSTDYQVYIKERPKRRGGGIDTHRFDRYIDEAAALHGVDFPLIKAVIRAESAFDPKAVSKKGALGLMQIMPENLKAFQVHDPFDPWQNIMGGARYLKSLIKRFKGQVPLALAAYNAGPQTVDIHHGIPPIPETETYVKRVMTFFYLYKKG
jgi:soluble lytic murein transglycosylase-like protein